MSLKTLKDFETIIDKEGNVVVRFSDLREEAIKWIKYKNEFFNRMHDESTKFNEDEVAKFKLVVYKSEDWIKYFFNLSEEDLE